MIESRQNHFLISFYFRSVFIPKELSPNQCAASTEVMEDNYEIT